MPKNCQPAHHNSHLIFFCPTNTLRYIYKDCKQQLLTLQTLKPTIVLHFLLHKWLILINDLSLWVVSVKIPPLKYEYFLFSFLLCDSELNIFGFRS